MPRETLNTPVTRLETVMAELAERQLELDAMVKVLLDSQIKTDQRFRETDQRLDERIEKLVSAIGELIRRNGSSN